MLRRRFSSSFLRMAPLNRQHLSRKRNTGDIPFVQLSGRDGNWEFEASGRGTPGWSGCLRRQGGQRQIRPVLALSISIRKMLDVAVSQSSLWISGRRKLKTNSRHDLMGGVGARPICHPRRITVADVPELSIDLLLKSGAIVAGRSQISTITLWGIYCEVESDLSDLNEGLLGIRSGPINGSIRLSATTPHFGGRRWWFLCPRSERRVLKLYWTDTEGFGSRQALRLVYPSSRENELQRAQRRLKKLYRKLDLSPFLGLSAAAKPRGMHWSTFESICREIDHESAHQQRLLARGLSSGRRG